MQEIKVENPMEGKFQVGDVGGFSVDFDGIEQLKFSRTVLL